MINVDIAKNMRKAGISITNEKVDLREKGIEEYLRKELSAETTIGLVQIYYTGICDKEIFDEFVRTFNEIDNTFSDDLVKEIQVLAGLVLCKMISQKNWDDIIALSEIYFEIYEFLGYKSMCDDIYYLMHNDFDNRRIKLRENISFEESKIAGLEGKVNFNVLETESIKYDDTVIENLDALVNKVNEVIKQLNNVCRAEVSHASILYEDSQLLWWLLTGVSDDFEDRYLKLEPKNAAILVGKDLAKRVFSFPGPYAVKTLLLKMLDFTKEQGGFSFDEYIESVDDEIISSFVGEEIEVGTPILYALKKKAENGSGNWSKVFSKRFSKRKSNYTMVDIAYETYLECLILQKE